MFLKALLKGLYTFIPVLGKYSSRSTGGTDSARYCYSVWMRHLTMAHAHGLKQIPHSVAELGPGDSTGAGLAALLSGSEEYLALDVKHYAHNERNAEIFDELIELFTNRAQIPDASEFPNQQPGMPSYEFPSHILTEDHLAKTLASDRVARLREAVNQLGRSTSDNSPIRYVAPWSDSKVVREGTIDFIFSQAVLEHVVDLPFTYRALSWWLPAGGMMSHAIDYRSHKTAGQWNGHWTYSDFTWKLILGRRPYLLNRQPHSVHLKLMGETGFELACNLPIQLENHLKRSQLADRFRDLSDDDLMTRGAFVQAFKSR